MNSDINEQYLNKVYEDLSREQMFLMNSMKTQTNNEKDKLITKQITQINTMMLNCLRLRNIKKELSNSSV